VIDIKEGVTFSGKSPFLGFFMFVAGAILLVFASIEEKIFAFFFAAPLLFFGVVVFMKIRGTLIDPRTKRCRVYQDFLLFKAGAWMDIGPYDTVAVIYYRERGRPNQLGGVAHINTYFVDLLGQGRPDLRLKELDDRKKALALGQQLAAALAIGLDDRSTLPPPLRDRRR
jgi:hypothetical protein